MDKNRKDEHLTRMLRKRGLDWIGSGVLNQHHEVIAVAAVFDCAVFAFTAAATTATTTSFSVAGRIDMIGDKAI